ncbi:DUF1273 domain-containing protein [Virgibacillus dokdonensis]|uniref:DUF1273 domain-containing protein n=1 Tax=Virgibacillus dokdonensis TaxID=302167 RepID=A0ABU7VID0_9BACI
MKILTVTGYKPMEINIFKEDDERITYVKTAIKKRLIPMIEEGLEWVILSGQMGVEMWTAEVILDLQDNYDVQLGIFPPFENQDSRWPEPLQEKYQSIVAAADFYKPLYQGDYRGAYQFKAKNLWLADKSDACLLLMDQEYPGSTRFFYEIAKRYLPNHAIYTITPTDLDDVVEEIRMANPDYWM